MTERQAPEGPAEPSPVQPPPPPFDPDLSLITYLEKGQGSDREDTLR